MGVTGHWGLLGSRGLTTVCWGGVTAGPRDIRGT